VAIIVETLTDNIYRTVSTVKSSFSKFGGNLGTAGSVSYMFNTKGIIALDAELYDEDNILEIILEAPVQDIKTIDDVIVIETDQNDLLKVKSILEDAGITEFLKSEIDKISDNNIELDETDLIKLERLIDDLEDNDDVQQVYTNIA
jgi:YebC/PmpR family DNA-binding regulatory protein